MVSMISEWWSCGSGAQVPKDEIWSSEQIGKEKAYILTQRLQEGIQIILWYLLVSMVVSNMNHGSHNVETLVAPNPQHVLPTTYSSLKIHFPPLLCASNQRSCTIDFSCSLTRCLSSCCSCVVGKSTLQNPGGVLRRS